jgi:hypothetical protein
MMEKNDSVTDLERIKDKRTTVFSLKLLSEVGRKHRKQLGSLLRMNLELTFRGNMFFLNGVNKGRCAANPQVQNFVPIYIEKYMNKGNRKYIRKEGKTIHSTATIRIFSSNYKNFALSFKRTQITFNRRCLY